MTNKRWPLPCVASVDYETDRKIQDTISYEFQDRTILCIARTYTQAHATRWQLIFLADRLRTIISYDRICVLDAGQIAVSLLVLQYGMLTVCMQEFDTPERLYDKPNGIFRGMCHQSSITLDDIKNASKSRQ